MVRPELDPSSLDRLEGALFAEKGDGRAAVRVGGEDLWRALDVAFPHRATGPAERRLFLNALEALAERGTIRLPPVSGKRWDRSLEPAVPTGVDLIRDRRTPNAFLWHTFPWHSELAWVPSCPVLSDRQIEFLREVHEGLVHGEFREPAPMKYRSLQLTGNEKGLASLAKTSLFGESRLSLAMLGCQPEILPLAWESVGDGGRMVIFENAGPFAVARRVLSEVPQRPYDLIAYGGGRSLLASLGHLRTIERRIDTISYVGDLDWAGLDIFVQVRRAAREIGLPDVIPAAELHRQMLSAAQGFGRPEGWPNPVQTPGDRLLAVLQPLDLGVRDQIASILNRGNRIPEEVLGPKQLRAAWRA